jgi:hypothetical protein
MTHKQATDPTALEVLLDCKAQFRAASSSVGGVGDEIARPADDDLVLACTDGHQQRDCRLEIRPGDPTELGVADIGLIAKNRV